VPFSEESATWKSGLIFEKRSGLTASTILSKGSDEWVIAFFTTFF